MYIGSCFGQKSTNHFLHLDSSGFFLRGVFGSESSEAGPKQSRTADGRHPTSLPVRLLIFSLCPQDAPLKSPEPPTSPHARQRPLRRATEQKLARSLGKTMMLLEGVALQERVDLWKRCLAFSFNSVCHDLGPDSRVSRKLPGLAEMALLKTQKTGRQPH